MQHTKTEDKRTAKRIRIISTQFLLVIYDFLIAVIACFPVVYGSDDLHMSVLWLHLILIIAVIFCIRLLLKVYKQVWRYGSIQSYLRLVIADSLAFVVYFAIDRFLTPGYVIVFSRALACYCMCLLGSLVMRMAYLYAYRSYRLDTVKGRLASVALRVASANTIELNAAPLQQKVAVAIAGAGSVGVALCSELLENPSSYCTPLCFVDTAPDKVGRQINGRPVISEDKNILRPALL